MKPGIVEVLVLMMGALYGIWGLLKKKTNARPIVFWTAVAVLIVFMLTSGSEWLYENIGPINDIQFPWRFLAALVFLPPVVLAFLLRTVPVQIRNLLIIVIVAVVCWARFPQLYGKNFIWYPDSFYYFTKANLHTTNLNTLWMGRSEDYPVQKEKVQVIEGTAQLHDMEVNNSRRSFNITSNEPTRMVDYTFYFPGWSVYVDDVSVPIEFQDEKYRGTITYKVPAGEHHVEVVFEDTRVRKLAKIISLVGVFLAALVLWQGKRFVLPAKK